MIDALLILLIAIGSLLAAVGATLLMVVAFIIFAAWNEGKK